MHGSFNAFFLFQVVNFIPHSEFNLIYLYSLTHETMGSVYLMNQDMIKFIIIHVSSSYNTFNAKFESKSEKYKDIHI